MRYWDASALAPLCVAEPNSRTLQELARSDGIVTWAGSVVEVASAIERRARERALSAPQRADAHSALRDLALSWIEITAFAPVRERALRLLATHPLRAADAMQLGAALVAASDRAEGRDFVCCDERLREAATREGFRVRPQQYSSNQ
jgi:predicted nucleic acid-binding protein